MRLLITLLAVGAAGCSTVLGITDPRAGDAGSDAGHTLTSIDITPSPLNLTLGTTRPLTATGRFSDGSSSDLTGQATWAIASGTSVTITPAGVVSAASPGASTVTATVDAVVGSITASVANAAPDHVTLAIGDFSIVEQQAAHFHASLVLTDHSVIDVTGTAMWSTDDPSVATAISGEVDGQLASGTATLTVGFDTAAPATVVVTVRPLLCHPIINEIQSGSAASADDEWVEVYNPCTVANDVDGWTLDYRAASQIGTQDTSLMVTLVGAMAPGELRLFAGPGFPDIADDFWSNGMMQQVNGAVGLRSGPKDSGLLVDSVAYGSVAVGHPFIEGTSTQPLANGKSAARLPFDGNDTDVGGADFTVITTPTPRALNAP